MTRSPPPQSVPTLTEIVAVPDPVPAAIRAAPADGAPPPVLDAALRTEIERLVDARLHAVLDTAWHQVLPDLVDATRRELASTLRDAIDRALSERSHGHRSTG